MESVPMEQGENADTDPSSKCLSTPVVLRKIMEHLPTTDLLKCCSFVNKLWNYEARNVLREGACVIAHFKSGHLCKDFVTFVSDLQTVKIVPFSGIHFDMYLDSWAHNKNKCGPSCTKDVDPTYKSVLDRLTWKRLSVTLHGHFALKKTCPGLLQVRSILQDRCGTLEELSLNLESPQGQLFIRETFENSRFPRLKVLKILGFLDAATDFIKALVTRSPNLKELHQDNSINFMENVLEGSSAVLITNSEFNPITDEFSESIIGHLRLKRMRLEHSGRDFSVERFNRIIPVLLDAFRTTLESLYADDIILVPLMCYGISFENVTKLEICSNYNFLELVLPDVFRALQAFDFTRIFPRLNRVHVGNYPGRSIPLEHIRVFLEQGNALWNEPKADRAAYIKHLTVPLKDYNVLYFAQMFPDIESLLVNANRETQVPYGSIWENWLNLRDLRVVKSGKSGARSTWNENLDSVFCGIFPEEIAQLREKDDEYLEKVNIVPVMPAITCMKDLRTFKLLNTERGIFSGETDETFVFSKVAGIIAFKRCPNLSVTLATNSNELEKAMGHMKPYADVVLGDN